MLPFALASEEELELEHVADPQGLGPALSDRIEGEIAADRKPRDWASISVRLTDGRTVRLETSDPIGSPEKPFGIDQMRANGMVVDDKQRQQLADYLSTALAQ